MITVETVQKAIEWLNMNSQEEYMRCSAIGDASPKDLTTMPYMDRLLNIEDTAEWSEPLFKEMVKSAGINPLLLVVGAEDFLSCLIMGIHIGIVIGQGKVDE